MSGPTHSRARSQKINTDHVPSQARTYVWWRLRCLGDVSSPMLTSGKQRLAHARPFEARSREKAGMSTKDQRPFKVSSKFGPKSTGHQRVWHCTAKVWACANLRLDIPAILRVARPKQGAMWEQTRCHKHMCTTGYLQFLCVPEKGPNNANTGVEW